MPFNWTFDHGRQELRSPAGRIITVREIAQMLNDRLYCRYDFAGEWSGWTMRKHFFIPPYSGRSGPKLTPDNAKRFLEWVSEPSREYAPRTPPAGRPSLRLVYTSSR